MNASGARRAALAAATAALVFGSGAASAQDIKERTLKFATQNPKGHPVVTGMEKFAEIVSNKSGGRIKVNLFPGGVLGGDAQNISALQGGTIERVVMNSGILASQVKEFAVFDFPFMFASPQEADAVVDGPFGQMMLAKLDAKNIHGLAYWELGFRNILLSDTAACARSWEQTARENPAYATYEDEDCYVIAGTDGSLSIPTMRIKTYPRKEDRSWWKPFEVGVVGMVRDDPLKHQMEHFGAVVRGDAQPLVSARDGLKNLRVTEAIAEAARSGKVIAIPAA